MEGRKEGRKCKGDTEVLHKFDTSAPGNRGNAHRGDTDNTGRVIVARLPGGI